MIGPVAAGTAWDEPANGREHREQREDQDLTEPGWNHTDQWSGGEVVGFAIRVVRVGVVAEMRCRIGAEGEGRGFESLNAYGELRSERLRLRHQLALRLGILLLSDLWWRENFYSYWAIAVAKEMCHENPSSS
jgi:hypothetical protein